VTELPVPVVEVRPQSQTQVEQLKTMLDAFQIFVDRNEVRNDMWSEHDFADAIFHLESKVARAKAAVDVIRNESDPDPEFLRRLDFEVRDSLLDTVNFAVFALRHFDAGRLG
jgi:hypothetical protein